MTSSESFVSLPEGKVKLVSGDGFEFIIDEEAARVSSTIRGMLDSQGKYLICHLPLISLKLILLVQRLNSSSPSTNLQVTFKRHNPAQCISEKFLLGCLKNAANIFIINSATPTFLQKISLNSPSHLNSLSSC